MKQQVFYIHGGCAFTEYQDYLQYLRNKDPEPFAQEHNRWNKRIASDLGGQFETFTPEMPNKYDAKYEEWNIWFENHHKHLRDGVILVGYSMGAMFLIKYLINNNPPMTVKGLVLIAPPYGYFKDEYTKEDGGDFNLTEAEDVELLAEKIPSITIYHSKDDFAVPYESALRLKEKLPSVELVSFEDRNHFLVEDFPELVERIKALG